MIGETLGGRYAIVRLLGEGGMGAVYEARVLGTGERVAVKVITGPLAQDRELGARFEREALAAQVIASENVVEVRGAGRDEARGVPYLAMEYLEGEDLDALFARLGPVPVALAVRLGVQACAGLAKAHAAGIVHRDVKPGNLFLAERDDGARVLKVLDFGIAKVLSRDLLPEGRKKSLTRTGAVLGSPLYMSPEQSRSRGELDHRSDLWSLGVVLYQALVGRTPFDHVESLGDFIVAVCTVPVTPIREGAPWVDPLLARAVERALAIDPRDRWASATEMADALRPFLGDDGDAIRAEMLVHEPEAGPAPPPPPDTERMEEAPATIPATPFGATSVGPVVVSDPALARAREPGRKAALAATLPARTAPVVVAPRAPAIASDPTPVPAKRGSSGAVAALAALGGAALVGGLALAWRGSSAPVQRPPVEPPRAPPSASAAPAPGLHGIAGSWWSEAGVAYDAVVVGDAVELRVVNADRLADQGYAPNETAYVLRPAEDRADTFRVEARVRPPAPRGMIYDRARSGTSCAAAFTRAEGKPLLAVHMSDQLVIQTVKLDPPLASFVREGVRVVGCSNLAAAHALPSDLVLGRTPVASPTAPRWPLPPHDAGAHDAGALPAGAHDAGPHDAGAHPPPSHDAGAPAPSSGKLGAPCEGDAQCASENCYAHRCMPPGKGYGAPCSMDWQCGTHHCKDASCR